MSLKKCAVCDKPGTKSEKLKVCSGCNGVAYCSKEHQREHWKVHKANCKKKAKRETTEVGVLWEDQQRINRFGRLNQRLMELRDEMKSKKKQQENLKDAKSEIEALLDDDMCRAKIGECFFDVSNEYAEEFVDKQTQQNSSDADKLAAEEAEITKELEILKSILYAKFGNQINLEYNE